MPMSTPYVRAAAALLGLTISIAGCGYSTTPADLVVGGDGPAATTTAATATEPDGEVNAAEPTEVTSPDLPTTVVDALGNEVTVSSLERIIPLDGTVAEVVFALGLGDNVVATDLSATYPPEADALPEIGYQRALTAEAIAIHNPTVLLATDIAGPAEVIEDLGRLGYPIVIVPNNATPDGPAAKIRAVAAALGVPERGEQLANDLQATIAANTATSSPGAPLVAALYLRGETAQLVLGTNSATHWLIEAAGGRDIATELGIDDATPISPEALLAAAPDILLIPAAGLESVGGIEGLLAIGGLGETPAGQTGAIVTIDDQLLLGNGPRTGELLAELVDALGRYSTS